MKALRTYSTPEQAYIVRGMLADAGIAAQVQDTGTNSVFPSLGGGTGGATLLVDEKTPTGPRNSSPRTATESAFARIRNF